MSWVARLLGRAPAASPEVAARTVVIPADVAAALTVEGIPLDGAVETALREQIAQRNAPPAEPNGDKPFWLAREDSGGDLEDRLRDRIAQRRAGEGEAER